MNGKVEVDFDVVKAQLRQVQDLPKAAVLNAMRGFVDASYEANMGMIPVQAAGVFLSKPDFERLFVGRLYRSVVTVQVADAGSSDWRPARLETTKSNTFRACFRQV